MRNLSKTWVVLLSLSLGGWACAQDVPHSRAMPGNDAPAGPYILYWGPIPTTPPHGRLENQWRYRLHEGRWWFWTANDNWSYYNGDIWVPYAPENNRLLSRASELGPIAGTLLGQGVSIRGATAGLTLIPGDHAGAPHLKRGTVLPRYLRQEEPPTGKE